MEVTRKIRYTHQNPNATRKFGNAILNKHVLYANVNRRSVK